MRKPNRPVPALSILNATFPPGNLTRPALGLAPAPAAFAKSNSPMYSGVERSGEVKGVVREDAEREDSAREFERGERCG